MCCDMHYLFSLETGVSGDVHEGVKVQLFGLLLEQARRLFVLTLALMLLMAD